MGSPQPDPAACPEKLLCQRCYGLGGIARHEDDHAASDSVGKEES
jgi:hypothetical protein